MDLLLFLKLKVLIESAQKIKLAIIMLPTLNILGITGKIKYRVSRKNFTSIYLGKPHHKKISVHLGIAQIAIGPPSRTQTGTLWHLFSGPILTF